MNTGIVLFDGTVLEESVFDAQTEAESNGIFEQFHPTKKETG